MKSSESNPVSELATWRSVNPVILTATLRWCKRLWNEKKRKKIGDFYHLEEWLLDGGIQSPGLFSPRSQSAGIARRLEKGHIMGCFTCVIRFREVHRVLLLGPLLTWPFFLVTWKKQKPFHRIMRGSQPLPPSPRLALYSQLPQPLRSTSGSNTGIKCRKAFESNWGELDLRLSWQLVWP